MLTGTLITPSGYHRSWRALIAAKFSGASITTANFQPGVTDADSAFLSKFPPSTVPVFEGSDGTNLFDANAIAFYLGTEELRGDRLTQADVTVFTALHPLFAYVLDENARKPYPHVVRWFSTVANQPNVLSVVGPIEMCVKEAQFDAKKYAELHPKETKKPKQDESKPKPGKKAEKKPVRPHVEETADDDEPKPVKNKNPFANLPDGNFDMDAFKRVYSNEDIDTVAIPYFWKQFDPETHSLWYCEYKFPEELGMVFMTANLIGGMFQRLERMIKYGFGSMCIFGKDRKNTIKGLWFWRGTGLAFDLSEDLQVDYESYEWRKLDPAAPESKALVHDYFLQKFEDTSFDQGRIFK